jgi:hypothetical protein
MRRVSTATILRGVSEAVSGILRLKTDELLGFAKNPDGDVYDKDIIGNTFKIGGRKFSTKHAYYLKLDARNLKAAQTSL